MDATIAQPEKGEDKSSLLHRIPVWVVQAVIIGGILIAGIAAINIDRAEQLADYEEDVAEAMAEAEEAEEAFEAEPFVFEWDEVYGNFAWIIIVATFAQTLFFGFRQRWAFASVMQVSLIIMLAVTFTLITQTVERDVYNVGVLALMFLTLFQIAFGNIDPQANFRQSLTGVVIAATIIGVIVAFSIWLAPYLIRLGQQ
ncbi:MAG: hypothetical protein AAF125_03910 [Chloroflexota bacterium]